MDVCIKKKLEFEALMYFIFILVSFIILIYFSYVYWDVLSDAKRLQGIIGSFGLLGPLVLMAAEAFQVVFPYLPGQVLSVAGGYIYGPWIGTIFNLIGVSLGSLIAFFISRKFGRPLVEKMFPKSKLKKFDDFFHKHGLIIIFLTRIQFFFPNDLVSYGSGLIKKMSWKKYLLVTFLGYIPHFFLLASLGSELQNGLFSIKLFIYAAIIAFVSIIYLLRKSFYSTFCKIEKIFKKKFKVFKKFIKNIVGK